MPSQHTARPAEPQLRGERLREHMLWSAKEVFLRTGYAEATMDAVAAEAGTSKRSLYAHFETKEKLFLAVLDLVRTLYLARLTTPEEYSADPYDAVVLFTARLGQLLTWDSQVRTFRLVAASVERLPLGATAYYDAMFASGTSRLADYLVAAHGLAAAEARAVAEELVDRAVLPRFLRAVLDVDPPLKEAEPDRIANDVDLDPIRDMVSRLLPSAPRRRRPPRR